MNDDKIQAAWEKARTIDGRNPDEWRKDCCGAVIRRSKYGDTDNEFGWQVDHIFPKATLEANDVPNELIDHDDNLRAMHWRNNNVKNNNYPRYKSAVTSQNYRNNIEFEKNLIVHSRTQATIKRLFKDHIEYFFSGDMNWNFDDIDLY